MSVEYKFGRLATLSNDIILSFRYWPRFTVEILSRCWTAKLIALSKFNYEGFILSLWDTVSNIQFGKLEIPVGLVLVDRFVVQFANQRWTQSTSWQVTAVGVTLLPADHAICTCCYTPSCMWSVQWSYWLYVYTCYWKACIMWCNAQSCDPYYMIWLVESHVITALHFCPCSLHQTLSHMLSVIPMAARGPTQIVMFDIHALQERFYFSHQVIPRCVTCYMWCHMWLYEACITASLWVYVSYVCIRMEVANISHLSNRATSLTTQH